MAVRRDLPLDEAIELVRGRGDRLETERVDLAQAYGRTLAADLASLVDHPTVDNSALDGYACRHADTLDASPGRPVRLRVVGDVPAGRVYEGTIGVGEAVGIYTGAPVPRGADAIVMVERTRRDGDHVLLEEPASTKDIRPRAQDLERGRTYLRAGGLLTPAAVGVAAAMGHARLDVVRRPRVAILSTGDEVVQPGTPLAEGQVYDSNSRSVAGLVHEAGGEAIVLPAVVDDPDGLRAALASAGRTDLIVTSGGVSMGRYDFVRDLLFDHGTVHFWKVAMRPGGPALFGEWNGIPVFGLPGNPVSSMVVFTILARPYLHALLGSNEPLPYERRFPAIARTPLKSAGHKTMFHRVRLELERSGRFAASSTGNQSSGVLTSMLHAHALAVVPPHADVRDGDDVDVIPLAPLRFASHGLQNG